MKVVAVSEEVRGAPSFAALRRAWPRYLLHDALSNEFWPRLYTERPQFQFALVDGDDVVAEGNSIPVAGMPSAWRDAFPNGFGGEDADRLCALAILVEPERQGTGLSRLMLEHMRALAATHGFAELVAPVRPTWKARYPLVPIERYASWRREDGLLLDPWLRVHERAGAELVGPADEAMLVEGTIAEWEEWADMAFPDSGAYVVPGALVPVEIDREGNHGRYVEPCVWMRHRL